MKDTIQYPDFAKLDMRVGLVKNAVSPEWSEKLLELTVDLGPEIGERTIMAGMKGYVEPEDMIGKKYIFLANLAERKMGESVSQGMMLAAEANEQPYLIPVGDDAPAGSIIL